MNLTFLFELCEQFLAPEQVEGQDVAGFMDGDKVETFDLALYFRGR